MSDNCTAAKSAVLLVRLSAALSAWFVLSRNRPTVKETLLCVIVRYVHISATVQNLLQLVSCTFCLSGQLCCSIHVCPSFVSLLSIQLFRSRR